MIAFKLAYRNLLGAGLRTWLNVMVLSMAYVIIIWQQGLLDGWNRQALHDMINLEIGGGQYWQQHYDPYDSFTLEHSHAPIPSALAGLSAVTPVLITQGTIYPQGRMQNCLLKGIAPGQQVLDLPTTVLQTESPEIPAFIGTRMARSANLQVGDVVTLRWRDAHGVFDAAEIKIVHIMKTSVSTVDQGQLWLPLQRLQTMLQLPDEATLMVIATAVKFTEPLPGWRFREPAWLTQDLTDMVKMKKIGNSVFYIVLLSLALLAIFDTQVLAIFRRRKEIGTLMALGMTRSAVISLFTLEGAMHGMLAALVAALYGIPLLSLQALQGYAMPAAVDNFGMAIADRIFPVYSFALVAGTTVIVLIAVTLVSFLPARRIAKLNPTDAIRGKLS